MQKIDKVRQKHHNTSSASLGFPKCITHTFLINPIKFALMFEIQEMSVFFSFFLFFLIPANPLLPHPKSNLRQPKLSGKKQEKK